MEDRFKFRIFEKETKEMIHLDAVGYSSFDPFKEGKSRLILILSGLNNTFHYDKQCLYDNEKFSEPMQCTGLKDKNLKLIYEGDIIRQPDGCIGVIVWQGVSYWTESPGSYARDLEHTPYYENVEVIGNVYENPELLEGIC